jgi:hypothetical protein
LTARILVAACARWRPVTSARERSERLPKQGSGTDFGKAVSSHQRWLILGQPTPGRDHYKLIAQTMGHGSKRMVLIRTDQSARGPSRGSRRYEHEEWDTDLQDLAGFAGSDCASRRLARGGASDPCASEQISGDPCPKPNDDVHLHPSSFILSSPTRTGKKVPMLRQLLSNSNSNSPDLLDNSGHLTLEFVALISIK